MGPSGCGKSTLLDVLAGRVGYAGFKSFFSSFLFVLLFLTFSSGKKGPDEEKLGGYTGEVRMAGMRMAGSEMKKHVAYVMQDDALYGVLTVRENLFYSAMLRLPDSMSKKGFFFQMNPPPSFLLLPPSPFDLPSLIFFSRKTREGGRSY